MSTRRQPLKSVSVVWLPPGPGHLVVSVQVEASNAVLEHELAQDPPGRSDALLKAQSPTAGMHIEEDAGGLATR